MTRTRLRTYLIVLAVVVNIINLLPVLQSPFLGDDAWRESCIRGISSLTRADLGQICWSTVQDYIRDGRWYPLVVYYYPAFYYLDRLFYKIGEIVFVLINVLLFGYLVQLITRNKNLFVLVLLVAPLFFQFRFYHDPILSYYYLMQIEFALAEASLIFFIWYIRKPQLIKLVASVFLFAILLLVYEAFYSFCAIYALVGYLELGVSEKKKIFKLSSPFFVLVAVNLTVALVIRTMFHTSYEGTTLSLEFWPWFTAFLKQVFAAVPLSYFFSFGHLAQAWDYAGAYFLNQLVAITVLWVVLWIFNWDYLSGEDSDVSMKGIKALGVLGLGFWIFPAFLVTLSAKYQRELKWGLGYLPVYVSCFGLMMIALMFLTWVNNTLRNTRKMFRGSAMIATALIGAAVVGLNFTNNNIVVQCYNDAEHYHRSLMEKALTDGLMNGVQEGSFLTFGLPVRSWDEPAFYRMHSGLELQVVKPPGFEMDPQLGTISYRQAFKDYSVPSSSGDVYDFDLPRIPRRDFTGYSAEFQRAQGVIVHRKSAPNRDLKRPLVYFVKYEAEAKDLGYAVLAHVTKLETRSDLLQTAVADSLRVYVRIPVGKSYNDILLTGNRMDPHSMKITEAFLLKENDLNLLSSDDRGKMFEVPLGFIEGGVDPKSVVATLTMVEN
ncbi:MAG: hypothetical protein WC647_00245 [Desulfomonilaceae bacterium]